MLTLQHAHSDIANMLMASILCPYKKNQSLPADPQVERRKVLYPANIYLYEAIFCFVFFPSSFSYLGECCDTVLL